MTKNFFASALSRPDPRAILQIAQIRRFSLAATASMAVLSLSIRSVLFLQQAAHPEWWLSFNLALAALACTIGLYISKRSGSGRMKITMSFFGIAAALPALREATLGFTESPLRMNSISGSSPLSFGTPLLAVGFALLALLLPFLSDRRRIVTYTVDFMVCLLVLDSFSLSARFFFGSAHLFTDSFSSGTPFTAVAALALLTFVAFTQHAEFGVFHVLFGTGISGRIARTLTPFCLLVPCLREAARARILHEHTLPEISTAATLAGLTSVVALLLLVLVCRKIKAMEVEIRTLSLRDELTGLYNLRGFRLLAEQALKLAERSGRPFSVLFVDLDYLKQINDSLGHQTGSEYLIDTAELLTSNFRTADVVGRIGGDEFAVAGQFTEEEIELAVDRLESQTGGKTARSIGQRRLSLSMGYVTTHPYENASLDDLLAEADAAMYERKRARKERQALPLAMVHGA